MVSRCRSALALSAVLLGIVPAIGFGGEATRPAASPAGASPASASYPADDTADTRVTRVTQTGPARPDTFGTTGMTAITLAAETFAPNVSTTTYTFSAVNGGQYITGGHPFLNHSLEVPEGSQIVRIELDGCDNDNAGSLTLRLSKCAVGGPCFDVEGVGTLPNDAPGCGRFTKDLTTAENVDNFNNSYYVNVETHGGPLASFFAVRVYYRLRVSPAPLTATFGDVPPTHLYFRVIEALAASGITSGCGSGNFCPDKPVTRGEMAKFLANALGLHWAP